MVTSGALMALRLTVNDIGSDQVSMRAECIGSRARKARNMALELRQKHLDAKRLKTDRCGRSKRRRAGPLAPAPAAGEGMMAHNSPAG